MERDRVPRAGGSSQRRRDPALPGPPRPRRGPFPAAAPVLRQRHPTGGPTLRKVRDASTRHYTGDALNPARALLLSGGRGVDLLGGRDADALAAERERGTLLSRTGLGDATSRWRATRSPRACVRWRARRRPIAATSWSRCGLGNGAGDTGNFEATGVFGAFLADRLRTEGEYELHVRAATTARSGGGGRRGAARTPARSLWSLVDVGIDAAATTSSTDAHGAGGGAPWCSRRATGTATRWARARGDAGESRRATGPAQPR